MIRKATAADLPAIAKGYRDLLLYERDHGSSTNWVLDLYPTGQTAERALERDDLYVLEDEGAYRGSMILNQDQAEEYGAVEWLYPATVEEVLVVHTLCIPPQQAGKGYGRQMVTFALEEARRKGCKVVRLDTWAENHPAASLYQKMGFRLAGTGRILLQGVIEEEQIYLERQVEG